MATLNNEETFSKLVNETRKCLINIQSTPEAIEPAIKKCSRHIRILKTALKLATNIGKKQHIINNIVLMNGYRNRMKSLRFVVGTGYKPSHPNRANFASIRIKWDEMESAFLNRLRTGAITNLKHKDPAEFLKDAKYLFSRRIKNALRKENALKVNATFCGEFVILKKDEKIFDYKYLKTRNAAIYQNTNIEDWFQTNIFTSIITQLEEFQEKDSGWTLVAIVNLVFNINKYNPEVGSSYIELPKEIKLKHACVNVKNNDESCFAWAVISALYPAASKIANRTTSYPHFTKILNLNKIIFPMTLKQIPRFEASNSISINVYILEKKERKGFSIVPTYLSNNKQEKHVNLLLIQDQYISEHGKADKVDGYKARFHYIWIKNLSRLLSSSLSKHNGEKHFCDRCLHYFHSNVKLEAHMKDCSLLNSCKVRLPKLDNSILQFKNYLNKEPAPFIIYADLECLLVPSQNVNNTKIHNHIPYSIGYYVKCSYDSSLSFYKSYRGENCQKWFVEELKKFAENVETTYICPLPMESLTPIKELEFTSSSHCHICEKLFNNTDIKVRDHCHFTGKYRGAAHEGCNINYKDSRVIPVVFHNLSGYDSHFIIKNLASDFEGRVDLLPLTKEQYISFTKNIENSFIKFRFIDSFRFLACGLETLVSYMSYFPILKSQFLDLDEAKFQLLTRKGVFPYEYLDSFSKLEEQMLPDKSKFYNSLNDTFIKDDDYLHATNIWNFFQCKTLGSYSDLYLKTDVLLLADVFEQFRSSCLQNYKLDPAHYYTLPGFTWDCMLKFTAVKLELLTDIDMILFIERGVRGGLSQCSKRYAAANNKYLPNYRSDLPSKFLIYDDINNQYGWAMSQYLPYGGFEWVEENVNNINFNIPADHHEGYLLEVDLEYPSSIHDSHNDLPFCPEHRMPPECKEQKLLATFYKKERYIIHYRNLKQALENGLILTKIHRILKFKQSDWLKSYIDLNTQLRTAAKNEFEKTLFKLMNNAVFGKTIENIRKHSIVKLLTKWEGRYGAEALIAKPNFKSSTIFADNLVAIELNKTEVYFNKPIYVGMCILDISKLKIYDFHYSYMRSRFGDKARICYTDTDSLIYEIECDDLYEVIRRDASKYFDTSDYPENNIYNIPRVNKKVLGMMKDENAGRIMTEFVGLRSKMYSFRNFATKNEFNPNTSLATNVRREQIEIIQQLEDGTTTKKIKGIKKCVVKNRITFDDYIKCLQTKKETLVNQKMFKSDKHNVSTVEQTKIALSPFDDKRYIIPNTYDTLSWGHWRLMELL